VNDKQTIFLSGPRQRDYAHQCIDSAPLNWMVTFQEQIKKREQEEKYHAQIGDIAKQCKFMGQKFDREDWKRMLIDAFARVKAEEGEPIKGWGRIIPSLDGTGFVQLGVQSRGFGKSLASEFIEHLYAFGSQQEPPVIWSKKADRTNDEEMMNRSYV
jgi:hypothetical protein